MQGCIEEDQLVKHWCRSVRLMHISSSYLKADIGAVMNVRRLAFVYCKSINQFRHVQMFEVTTLGQPLEVLKTQMASNRSGRLVGLRTHNADLPAVDLDRSQTMNQAFKTVWSRGGVLGCACQYYALDTRADQADLRAQSTKVSSHGYVICTRVTITV